MKHGDLLTALGLTLGHGRAPNGIALRSYRQVTGAPARLRLFGRVNNNRSD